MIFIYFFVPTYFDLLGRFMPAGYNKGDAYEAKIHQICVQKGITPLSCIRGGAGSNADLIFIHNKEQYNLEIKFDLAADYGQKMLRWENNAWRWCVDDETTRIYTGMGVLDILQKKNFIPNKHTIENLLLTQEHKSFDQSSFESSIDIETDKLFSYYAGKNCYYIQIGGYGFYYLAKDILNLDVPRFDGTLKLRFRAKTIHSNPLHAYGFYAVLKVNQPPTKSTYDIEELGGRQFPPIKN